MGSFDGVHQLHCRINLDHESLPANGYFGEERSRKSSLLLVVQIGFVVAFGVRNTRSAVMFNFASSFCYVAAHSYVAIYGFLKGQRNEPPEFSPLPPGIDPNDPGDFCEL